MGIAAHSHGNIMASEAQLQGAMVNRYVMMNAAAPAGCYDERDELLTPNTQLPPNLLPILSLLPLPHTEPDQSEPYGGYRKYFRNLSGLFNFHHVRDRAVGLWVLANDIKRNTYMSQQPGAINYFFEPTPIQTTLGPSAGVMMIKHFLHEITLPPIKPRPAGPPLGNAHESMSQFAQSRTMPVGLESRTRGAIQDDKSLIDFFGDTGTTFANHSLQFDRPIQFGGPNGMMKCYRAILDTLFPPP